MSTQVETRSFTISCNGDKSGEKWVGKFAMKMRLSHRDYMNQDQIRRQLLGADSADNASPRAVNTAEVFSLIWSRVTEAPDWWKSNGNGYDLEDDNVIAEVYDGIMKLDKAYQEERKKTAEEALKDLK